LSIASPEIISPLVVNIPPSTTSENFKILNLEQTFNHLDLISEENKIKRENGLDQDTVDMLRTRPSVIQNIRHLKPSLVKKSIIGIN